MRMADARDLVRRFGGETALAGVSFAAEAGERIALVGRNGAGKTTLLRILSGLLAPDSGAASVAGLDVWSQSVEVRRVAGYLPEGAPLEPDMTVADFLRYRGKLRRMPGRHLRRRLHEVADFCDLARILRLSTGSLSSGQRHAVALADCLLHEPRVLLLDDPLAALDSVEAEKFSRALLSPQVSDGRLVVFATHDEALVRSVASRVLVLERGRIVGDMPGLAPGLDLAQTFEACLKGPDRLAEGGEPR